jgi:hypothetical protein
MFQSVLQPTLAERKLPLQYYCYYYYTWAIFYRAIFTELLKFKAAQIGEEKPRFLTGIQGKGNLWKLWSKMGAYHIFTLNFQKAFS